MIRAALGTSHFMNTRFLFPCMYHVDLGHNCDPGYCLENACQSNHSTESRYFWYHFTPRKLLYLMVSVNFVKCGPHWLSVLGHPVLALTVTRCDFIEQCLMMVVLTYLGALDYILFLKKFQSLICD